MNNRTLPSWVLAVGGLSVSPSDHLIDSSNAVNLIDNLGRLFFFFLWPRFWLACLVLFLLLPLLDTSETELVSILGCVS